MRHMWWWWCRSVSLGVLSMSHCKETNANFDFIKILILVSQEKLGFYFAYLVHRPECSLIRRKLETIVQDYPKLQNNKDSIYWWTCCLGPWFAERECTYLCWSLEVWFETYPAVSSLLLWSSMHSVTLRKTWNRANKEERDCSCQSAELDFVISKMFLDRSNLTY